MSLPPADTANNGETMDYKQQDRISSKLRRWLELRPMELRTACLRAILCYCAHEDAPIYTGIDPATGEFSGPSLAEYASELIGYFIGSRDARYRSNVHRCRAERAFTRGYCTAYEHAEMDRRTYAERS